MAADRPLDVYSQIVSGVAEKLTPKVASLRVPQRGRGGTGESLGSGVVFTGDGFLLTNAHVVGQADSGTAAFSDGTTAPFRVIGADHAEGGHGAVRKRRRATLRLTDDVCVGEQESVAGEDDTRAEALAAGRAATTARDPQAGHFRGQLLGHARNYERVRVQRTVCCHEPPPFTVITALQINREGFG